MGEMEESRREHEMMQGPVNFQAHIGGRGIIMKEIKNVQLGSFLQKGPPSPRSHRKIASGGVFGRCWGPSAFFPTFPFKFLFIVFSNVYMFIILPLGWTIQHEEEWFSPFLIFYSFMTFFPFVQTNYPQIFKHREIKDVFWVPDTRDPLFFSQVNNFINIKATSNYMPYCLLYI